MKAKAPLQREQKGPSAEDLLAIHLKELGLEFARQFPELITRAQ